MQEIIRIDEHSWRIEDGGVRFFLLEGEREALLIDTGMNAPDAKKIAEGITRLPIKLINTHADMDHVSGNAAFDEFYMNPAERGNYEAHGGRGTILPVGEGDVIDIGGRTLAVIELPGHTPGSIALLEVSARVLIGGDAIQDGRIFMFGAHRNLDAYIESLTRLNEKYAGRFDTVWTSHGTFPLNADIVGKLIAAAESVRAGEAEGKPTSFMGKEIVRYDMGCAGFLCDKK